MIISGDLKEYAGNSGFLSQGFKFAQAGCRQPVAAKFRVGAKRQHLGLVQHDATQQECVYMADKAAIFALKQAAKFVGRPGAAVGECRAVHLGQRLWCHGRITGAACLGGAA